MAVARKSENRVVRRQEVAEPEPEPERQHHPDHRRDQRRPPEIAQEAHVGLEAGQEQEHRHPDAPERVEQVELLRARREDGGEGVGEVVSEQARAESDARRELPDDGRQPHPLGQLGAEAGRGHQERELDEEQEDRVARQGGYRRRQARGR